MSCQIKVGIQKFPNPILGSTFIFPDYSSPPLMVSDNPETVPPGGSGILWQHTMPLGNPRGEHWIFLNHVNATGSNGAIAVTVTNLDFIDSIPEPTLQYATAFSGDYVADGIDLASCLVTNSLPMQDLIESGPIFPGQTHTMAILPWNNNGIRMAQMILKIPVKPPFANVVPYYIRTLYGPTTNKVSDWDALGGGAGQPPGLTLTHARGSWPYSANYLPTIPYGIGAPTVVIPITSPPHFTKAESGDKNICSSPPCISPDNGPFGAVIKIPINIWNGSKKQMPVNVYLVGTARPGVSAGAIARDSLARTFRGTQLQYILVDTIKCRPCGSTDVRYRFAIASTSVGPDFLVLESPS